MSGGWMQALIARAAPGARILSAESLGGGHANDLYRVTLAGEGPRSVVVRAWRRDPSVAARELAVMELARPLVPLPRLLAAEPAGERPAAVLEDMPGWRGDQALERFPDEAGAIGCALGEVFARLSSIRFPAAGFFLDASLAVSPFGGSAPEQLLAFVRPQLWSERVQSVLGLAGQAAWWRLIESEAPVLAGLERERSLVHADANPKNVLLERVPAGWRVSAVLDWEFAFSGPSLMDLGNLLRFEDRTGTPFGRGVLEGWRGGGGPAPQAYERQARALDVYSLIAFVAAPESALHERVVQLVRRQLREGRL